MPMLARTPHSLIGRKKVIGLFVDQIDAENALNDLRNADFSSEQIGVATRDRDEEGFLFDESGRITRKSAVSGAIGGGLLGVLTGWLVGAGAIAIPGVGPVVAGGVLASAFGIPGATAFAGAGIGTAAGGIVGIHVGLGMTDEDSNRFEIGFKNGGILVTVNDSTRAHDAIEILQNNGADTAVLLQ